MHGVAIGLRWVTALGKPLGLLVLLSTQVGVGQEIAQAEALLPVASSSLAAATSIGEA